MNKKNNHVLGKFLKFAFSTDKTYFVLLALSCIMTALTNVFGAYSISIIIKYIEDGSFNTSNSDAFNKALLVTLIVVGIEGLLFILTKIIDNKKMIASRRVSELIKQRLAKKVMSLQFCYLEDNKYLEIKKAAEFAMINMGAITQFTNSVSIFISNGITLISLGAIISTFDYSIVLILGVGIIIAIIMAMILSKAVIKFYSSLIPINYKYGYYVDSLISNNGMKDFRMYPTYDIMKSNYDKFTNQINNEFMDLAKKNAKMNGLSNVFNYSIIGLIYILVGLKTIKEHLSISSFSLVVSSAISFSSSVSSMINSFFDVYQAIGYVKPLVEFMDLAEEKDEGTIDLDNIDTIEFSNVSFIYPATTKKVLDDVSFIINSNEKISIVGLNGAGKTTIVKLICKMYKPTSGEIKVNGINIYEYKYDEYMNALSTVFQDYKLFNYSILDNIKPNLNEQDGAKIIEKVGLKDKIDSLTDGVNSNLGKDYDEKGIEMSGGEKQKIAIARSIAKEESKVLILDEPTSALDPIAEAEIYENFNKLSENKMAIFISHRMSSSIFCDKILVLNDGKVEDYAPHHELMKKTDSLYYKLYTTQAKNYQLKKEMDNN